MSGADFAAMPAPVAAGGGAADRKLRRRERILTAARVLVRASGVDGFTMRTLAAGADVAFVTLYNYFGSKRAILCALAAQPEVDAMPAAEDAEAIVELTFSALDRFTEHYLQDPKLFKPVWLMLFEPSSEASPVSLPSLNESWARRLLSSAQAFGVLSESFSLEQVFELLDLLVRSAIQSWASGALPQGRLRPTVCFGAAVILAGAATPAWREQLQARALDWQAISHGFTNSRPRP